MHLLYRRPLACICVCFLCALYGAQYLASSAKLVVMAILCPLALIALLWVAFSKQHRLVLLTLFLCLISLFLGVFHIYAWIDRPYEEALARTGSRTVELQVISHEYSTEYSSQYLVELTKIGEDRVSIRSYMVCGFVSDLQAGDEIYARVELKEPDQMTHGIVPAEKCRDSRVLLTTVLYDAEDGVGLHRGAEDSFFNRLFKRNGIEMLSYQE